MAKVTESSRRGGAASHPPPARVTGPGPAGLPRHGGPSPSPAQRARPTPAALAPGSSPRSPHAPGVLKPSPRPPLAPTPGRNPPDPPPRRSRPFPHPQSPGRALGPGRIPARVRVTASTPGAPQNAEADYRLKRAVSGKTRKGSGCGHKGGKRSTRRRAGLPSRK